MRSVKQIMIIISLFTLLFAVVFIPMFYIEYQNNNIFNEFYISPVKTMHLDRPSQEKEDYNIWERIGIMNTSIVVRSTVPAELRTTLREEMEKQLKAICRYKAIPDISLTGVMQASIHKETYMEKPSSGDYLDILDSNRVLNVWEIIVEYQNYVVCAYMDTKTNAIYDIMIVTKNTDFLYQSEISDTGFLEYLKTFSDVPSDLGIAFSAEGYYSGEKICLYLCSVGKDSKLTIHRFNNNIAMTDAYPLYKDMESDAAPLYKATESDDESRASVTNSDSCRQD